MQIINKNNNNFELLFYFLIKSFINYKNCILLNKIFLCN